MLTLLCLSGELILQLKLKLEDHFETMPQVSPIAIGNRENCKKSVHPCKFWRPRHSRVQSLIALKLSFQTVVSFLNLSRGAKTFQKMRKWTEQKLFDKQNFLSFLNSSIVCRGRYLYKNYFKKKVKNIIIKLAWALAGVNFKKTFIQNVYAYFG